MCQKHSNRSKMSLLISLYRRHWVQNLGKTNVRTQWSHFVLEHTVLKSENAQSKIPKLRVPSQIVRWDHKTDCAHNSQSVRRANIDHLWNFCLFHPSLHIHFIFKKLMVSFLIHLPKTTLNAWKSKEKYLGIIIYHELTHTRICVVTGSL